MQERQNERYWERMRTLDNVRKMDNFEAQKRDEYREKEKAIDQKVEEALWRKQMQLDAKRDRREEKAQEKEMARARNLEYDSYKRD